MADGIVMQSGGGGGAASEDLTATADKVLLGALYVGADTDDEAGVGGMPNHGALRKNLRAGERVAIPKGYHDGTGEVTAATLAEQTPGNAGPGDILAGKGGWVNGRRVDGNIPVVVTDAAGARGNITEWYGIDGNARTFWMELPYRSAYYTRGDNKPHICMDYEALGNAVREQLLQGATATSKYGLKFEGAIQSWVRSGDIGGQGVMDAYENTAFAGDYGARGRVVFMRMPGGAHINPDIMWAQAPAPTLLPHNVRAGVSILGVSGTMVDYAASCVPFDGAHFDGVHMSGWAEGLINTRARYSLGTRAEMNPARSAEVVSAIGGTTSGGGEPAIALWVLTPSVALLPFRRAVVTVSYSTNADIMPHGNGVNVWAGFSRINGARGKRTLAPIREKVVSGQRTQSGRVTLDIPLDGVAEQGFLVVAAHGSNFRKNVANSVFTARLERVELIA